MEISLGSCPSLPKYFHDCEKDSHLLIHYEKPLWIIVNNLGIEIIKLIETGLTIGEVINIISKRFGINQEQVFTDISSFLKDLIAVGFLETANSILTKQSLKSITIDLTYRCNLRCKHCYLGDKNNEEEMSTYTVFSLIDQFQKMGGKVLVISGGEPLLRSDFRDVLFYACNKGLSVKVGTNGLLLNNELSRLFLSLGVGVQISLEGSTANVHDAVRGKGTFAKTIECLDLLKKVGMDDITLATTVMKYNLDDIPNIMKLADEYSIKNYRLLPLRRLGRANQNWIEINADITYHDYERLFQYIFYDACQRFPSLKVSSGLEGVVLSPKKIAEDGFWCPIGRNLVVTPAGECYPCVKLQSKKYYLGSIYEKSLSEILNSKVLIDLVHTIRKRRFLIKKCQECIWRNFCQSGCMAMVEEAKGTIWDTDEYCEFRKRLYRSSVFTLGLKKLDEKANPFECT